MVVWCRACLLVEAEGLLAGMMRIGLEVGQGRMETKLEEPVYCDFASERDWENANIGGPLKCW